MDSRDTGLTPVAEPKGEPAFPVCFSKAGREKRDDVGRKAVARPESLARADAARAASDQPSPDEPVRRAKAMAPKLLDRAVDAERNREIPLQTVEEFIDAGVMRTLVPKRWGGYEYGFETAFEIGRSTCGSSAWCLSYLADHAYLLALFPDEAQHHLWSRNLDVGIATSFAPTGKTTIVDGGPCSAGAWRNSREGSWPAIPPAITRSFSWFAKASR